jgi:hypothetical protein
MALAPEQVAKLDPLSAAFLAALRSSPLGTLCQESFTDRLQLTIPAKAPSVGDLRISGDGSELTVYLGEHTHSHFALYMFADLPRSEAISGVVSQTLKYLSDVVSDQVVVWSHVVNGRVVAGGSYGRSSGPGPLKVRPEADAYLWSGARVLLPRPHGGA